MRAVTPSCAVARGCYITREKYPLTDAYLTSHRHAGKSGSRWMKREMKRADGRGEESRAETIDPARSGSLGASSIKPGEFLGVRAGRSIGRSIVRPTDRSIAREGREVAAHETRGSGIYEPRAMPTQLRTSGNEERASSPSLLPQQQPSSSPARRR